MILRAPSGGILIAFIMISVWLITMLALLQWNFSWQNPLVYLMILVQMHLYTGLFITAHDAMHGTVSPSARINFFVGQLCSGLYAAFSFRKLSSKHHQHHRYVHSERDPDYHHGNFLAWYVKFIRQYISIGQILILALVFNVLKVWFAERNLLLFWVLPPLLSTLQLF